MTRNSSLPPDYTIRQLRNIDIQAIYQITMLRFNSLKNLIIFFAIVGISIVLILCTICIFLDNCSISLQDFLTSLVLIPLETAASIVTISTLQIARFCCRQDGSIVLLIEYNSRLVAYAMQSNKGSYSLLNSLYVKQGCRCQGLGSCLVQNLARKGVKPIYVLPTPESFRFYIRLGFTLVQKQNLPHKLQSTHDFLGLM